MDSIQCDAAYVYTAFCWWLSYPSYPVNAHYTKTVQLTRSRFFVGWHTRDPFQTHLVNDFPRKMTGWCWKNISQWERLSHILWKNRKCSKPLTRWSTNCGFSVSVLIQWGVATRVAVLVVSLHAIWSAGPGNWEEEWHFELGLLQLMTILLGQWMTIVDYHQ